MAHVAALYRYPVKGLTPERLDTLVVQDDGRVAGDRVLAFRFADAVRPEERDGLDYWPKARGLALMDFPSLARLRLETEMSVADEDARAHMAADISQLDAIIDKFLDYARPDHVQFKPVLLRDVIDACTYAVQDYEDVEIKVDVAKDLAVMADDVELTRVISNLLENARRYGKTPGKDVAQINIQAQAHNDAVLLKVRDHGAGVAPALLSQLTKPFFRGDVARTSAAGAGLGLSIVAKNIERMGGTFALTSTPGRGFAAHIRMQRASMQAATAGKEDSAETA